MISSIQGSTMQGVGSRPVQTPLNAEQKTLIQDKLAGFDVDNISEQDKQDLASLFEELGVKPSKEVAGLMEDAGLDPAQMRPQGAPPPPPQGEQSSVDPQLSSLIQSFVEQFENGDVDESDLSAFVESLQSNGFGSSGNILDTLA